jgi:hypothetical protein
MASGYSSDLRIYNGSGEIIPACAIARLQLGQWDPTGRKFPVLYPSSDNQNWSELVSIRDSVPVEKIGLACMGNFIVALSKPGDVFDHGDKAGTETNQWWLKKISDDDFGNNEGQFLVIEGLVVPDDWQDSTYYDMDSLVKIDNVMYICIQPHIGDGSNRPGTGIYWQSHWHITDSQQIIVRPRNGDRLFGHFTDE